MQSLHRPATPQLPEIFFDTSDNTLLFRGVAIPETLNHLQYHEEWLLQLLQQKPSSVQFLFNLHYHNNVFAKFIQRLFSLCEAHARKQQCSICVIWKYEEGDQDMLEFGKEFQEMYADFTFQLLEIKA